MTYPQFELSLAQLSPSLSVIYLISFLVPSLGQLASSSKRHCILCVFHTDHKQNDFDNKEGQLEKTNEIRGDKLMALGELTGHGHVCGQGRI